MKIESFRRPSSVDLDRIPEQWDQLVRVGASYMGLFQLPGADYLVRRRELALIDRRETSSNHPLGSESFGSEDELGGDSIRT